jgi:hypothetical protein
MGADLMGGHKSRHNVPSWYVKQEPISDRYQAEVDRSTAKLEKQYRDAEKRAEATARRRDKVARQLEREAKNRKLKKQLAELEALVVEREQELDKIRRLMLPGNYAGGTHRPVPRQSSAM